MKKKLSLKENKELERRFGKLAETMAGYHDRIDFRLLDNFDDEAFAYLMENVKAVNMLDLNETDISNKSITLLTSLEYVNELRAKECRHLNNDCVTNLNKIKSLSFLHLKSTSITIDGLLHLKNLSNLKTLMFSADDVDAIKEKLLQLKTMLPACEIVVNSKPYYINAIDIFVEHLKTKPFNYRLKIKNQSQNSDWSNMLVQTADDNIEADAQGINLIADIEWIEIKPMVDTTEIVLADSQKSDHFVEIIKLLTILEFPYMKEEAVVFAYIINKAI